MFALAQAPPDHAHRLRTQRNRRTSFCGGRSRCRADLIAAVGDRCPIGATADEVSRRRRALLHTGVRTAS